LAGGKWHRGLELRWQFYQPDERKGEGSLNSGKEWTMKKSRLARSAEDEPERPGR
jgi:hypothetical protein